MLSLKKKINYIILLFLPILFVLICINYKTQISHYSLNHVDPEMAYLYNALAITNGHICNFVDHPGIPIQYISAIVISTVNLFKEGSLDENIIKNPDFYLHSISITFIFLNAVLLFMLGLFTYKYFKNLLNALFIQLTPFFSIVFLEISNRILPEFFSFIIVSLFFIFVLYFIKSYENNDESKLKKSSLFFALISAFAISVKITLAPFILIPLILLKNIREKIKFIFYLFLSLLFFLFPVFNRFDYFFSWIKKLLVNSGQYGQGNNDFVDKDLFIYNINSIIDSYPLFVATFIILLIGIIIYFIPAFNLRQKNDKWFQSYISFILILVISVLILSKQLKFYYLSHAFLITIPSLFILILILKRNPIFNKTFHYSAFILLSFFIFYTNIIPSFAKFESDSIDRQQSKKNIIKIISANKLPTIEVSHYYGSPFYGYSARYGEIYSSNKQREDIIPILKKLLPDYYSFHAWNNKFNYWNDLSYTLPQLINKYSNAYLYLGDNEKNTFVNDLSLGVNRKHEYKRDLLFSNDKTGEKLFKISKIKEFEKHWILFSNMENLTDNKEYFIFDNDVYLWGGQFQNSLNSLSGKYSCELSKTNNYGLICFLTDVEEGDIYKVSVWKKKNGNNNSNLYIENKNKYTVIKTGKVVEEINGWEKIQIDIIVNEEIADEDLKIYCFQNNDDINSYWDDFSIEKKQEKVLLTNLKSTNGNYFSIFYEQGSGKPILTANKKEASTWEKFSIVINNNGTVGIVSYENKYLTINFESKNIIEASSDLILQNEVFYLEKFKNNIFAIKAINGKYLSVDKKTNLIFANSDNIGECEKFEIINLKK